MDVFTLDKHMINNYSNYIKSFINIKDQRIKEQVDNEINEGLLWPEPLIQLNPSFKPGLSIDDLVDKGILHPECGKIFRVGKKEHSAGRQLRLHQHQVDAINAGKAGDNYVLTTGTGSGKSLAYIIPIVDYVLRNQNKKGIKAIVIYPMNALANSQHGELEKFLCEGYPPDRPPVTFHRYTGQENQDQRDVIIANPPDILLTNYVMLELIMTRVEDKKLFSNASLKYVVLDELHTYRGRQGADVAMLIRRLSEKYGGSDLQFVGTSATLASEGSYDKQKEDVAEVASLIFGSEVKKDRVIMETLQRATKEYDFSNSANIEALKDSILKNVIECSRFPDKRKKLLSIKSAQESKIREIVERRNIRRLVHFTRIENLSSILENGLVPVIMQEENNINSIRNDMKRIDALLNCTSFSIEFPNYRLFYYFRQKYSGSKWVVLEIDINVLFSPLNISYFCRTNAASVLPQVSSLQDLCTADSLEDMFSDNIINKDIRLIQRKELKIDKQYTTDPQAEVLISDLINRKYITCVCFNSEIDSCEFRRRNRSHLLQKYYYTVDESYFGPRSDYDLWRKGY